MTYEQRLRDEWIDRVTKSNKELEPLIRANLREQLFDNVKMKIPQDHEVVK
jgi:hypothetical protein